MRGSQPMSANRFAVRSTLSFRSELIAGSIKRFGVAETSQCDTLEPPWNGLGAYRSTWPPDESPACLVGESRSVTFTVPAPMAVLSVEPSACVMPRLGMVMVGSEPAGESAPAALFTMIAPTAPAFWAFLTFSTNVHVPRPSGPGS